MTIASDMWQPPRELPGVKSRKRPIFEIALGSLDGAIGGVHRVSGLKLTLESRVAALGPGGEVAMQLLLGQLSLKGGKVQRHEGLAVARLGEHLAGEEASEAEHFERAASELNEQRPQVVVLETWGGPEWEKASSQLLEALRGFRGAVVVAAEEEDESVKSLCPVCWRNAAGWLWQEPLKQDLMVLDDIKEEDADEEVKAMLQEVRTLSKEAFFGEDSVQKAADRGWTLSLLVDTESESKKFCGFICYHLSTKSSEFHVARIAVVARSRGRGYGKHFMQWTLKKCALLPRTQCAWNLACT
ncbi:unnamed protein product [Symbiodinium pilosum]|uniref:N-acetyltransferase domain-containing protein n=1 Tax=Symbiodinium pilosum TaxID=2952 RepID=A0A812SSS5_SYMPI|nr:unnamed protein product [Symbiodinium pilosum]